MARKKKKKGRSGRRRSKEIAIPTEPGQPLATDVQAAEPTAREASPSESEPDPESGRDEPQKAAPPTFGAAPATPPPTFGAAPPTAPPTFGAALVAPPPPTDSRDPEPPTRAAGVIGETPSPGAPVQDGIPRAEISPLEVDLGRSTTPFDEDEGRSGPSLQWRPVRPEPELDTSPVVMSEQSNSHSVAGLIDFEVAPKARPPQDAGSRTPLDVEFGGASVPSIQIDHDYQEDAQRYFDAAAVDSFEEQTPTLRRPRIDSQELTAKPVYVPESALPALPTTLPRPPAYSATAEDSPAPTKIGDLLDDRLKPIRTIDAAGKPLLVHPAPFPLDPGVWSKRPGPPVPDPQAYSRPEPSSPRTGQMFKPAAFVATDASAPAPETAAAPPRPSAGDKEERDLLGAAPVTLPPEEPTPGDTKERDLLATASVRTTPSDSLARAAGAVVISGEIGGQVTKPAPLAQPETAVATTIIIDPELQAAATPAAPRPEPPTAATPAAPRPEPPTAATPAAPRPEPPTAATPAAPRPEPPAPVAPVPRVPSPGHGRRRSALVDDIRFELDYETDPAPPAAGVLGKEHLGLKEPQRAGEPKRHFSELEIAFFEEDLHKVEDVDDFQDLVEESEVPETAWEKIFGKTRKQPETTREAGRNQKKPKKRPRPPHKRK